MGFLDIGIRLFPLILTSVESVERFVKGKGGEKEDAAVQMVDSILKTVEAGTNKDLLNDDAVNAATRDVIKAVVSLQNVVKPKGGGQSFPPCACSRPLHCCCTVGPGPLRTSLTGTTNKTNSTMSAGRRIGHWNDVSTQRVQEPLREPRSRRLCRVLQWRHQSCLD